MVPESESLIEFYWHALGMKYIVILALGSIFSLAMIAFAIIRWRNPASAVIILVCAPMPLLLGWLSNVDGMIQSFDVIANSPTQPKPGELSRGIAMAMVGGLVGGWLTLPNILLATIGCAIRLLNSDAERTNAVSLRVPVVPQPASTTKA